MDSLTHIVLGACIGEVMVGKKIGRRALLMGAIAQSLPDIDFLASFFLSPTSDLLAHRGFTHSFLFALIVTPVLALLADRWRRPHDVSFATWLWFFGIEVFTHIMLDGANMYGTGWLEPFDHRRFSYHALFVADIFFSIVPAIVFAGLLIFKSHKRRRRWALIAIVWCSVYLTIGFANRLAIENTVDLIAEQQHITWRRQLITPTPLNNLLWYVVLEDEHGYHVGYRSVFDKAPRMDFHYFPRNDSLLEPVKDGEDLKDLLRFSQGFYTVAKWKDTLVFNDLRFGQIIGWENNAAPFTFYYFLERPYSNDLVVQRGRFARWNKAAIRSLWQRMKGNE
jgi:inner membrane protein